MDNIQEELDEVLTEEELEADLKSLDFSNLKSADASISVTTDTNSTTNTTEVDAEITAEVQVPSSKLTSNLQRFHFICKDLPSDNLFINFDFYFMIASCLARRCWIGEGDMFRIYPNLYIVCVSNPGLGKSLPARTVNTILSSLIDSKFDKSKNKFTELKLINLGPDAITYEKLILRAAGATDAVKMPNGKLYHHASTTFCLGEELGMLFSDNTRKVVSFLMQAYDCHKFEGDTIKNGSIVINNICINFLGCTTPGILKDLLKTKVLDDGFTGRALFLYTDTKRKHPATIKFSDAQGIEMEVLKKHLRKLAKLPPTQLEYSSEAQEWINHWHETREDFKLNSNYKMLDYYARRRIQLLKLSIAHAMADKIATKIEVEDLQFAEKLLASAEINMHKALTGTMDNPLSSLVESIKTHLQINGPTNKKKIILSFHSQAKNGIVDIQKALEYLKGTDQILIDSKDGKEQYSVK